MSEIKTDPRIINGIPYGAEELLRRAVQHPTKWKCGEPRWAAVARMFQLGSSYATILCHHFGINPHEEKYKHWRHK